MLRLSARADLSPRQPPVLVVETYPHKPDEINYIRVSNLRRATLEFIESTHRFLKKHNLEEFKRLHSMLKVSIPQLVEWGCIDVSVTEQAEKQHQVQQQEVEWDLSPSLVNNPEVTAQQQKQQRQQQPQGEGNETKKYPRRHQGRQGN